MDQRKPVQGPLKGRTIVLTRRVEQAREMTEALERLGAKVVCFPTIETIPPDDWTPLDSAVDRIEDFDWVIFTSSNAVRFVGQRLTSRQLDLPSVLSGLKVLAIGPATQASLKDLGREADLVALDSKAEGALKTLIESLGSDIAVAGLKILIPRAAVARDFLPRELARLGAQVEAVEAYRTVKPEVDSEGIFDLFRRGEVDVVAFTSSSTVTNFAALAGETSLSDLLREVAVACIGPLTSATASALGLKVVIQPESYSGSSLVQGISQYFSTLDS